jgi:hypothetical protein
LEQEQEHHAVNTISAKPAQTSGQFKSQSILEFLRRDACHFECAPQGSKGNLPVHGNDAAALALRRDFLEDGMTAALAINEESESL